MIKELRLKHFGKFQETRFPLGGMTLFLGKNEAGKTTIFDAIFQELCRPKASKRFGKALAERYGAARETELLFEGTRIQLDEDEFFNLYALRSGDISLDMSTGSSWMDRVKAGLFTGGIDPNRIASKFDTLASDRGSFKHNRELRQWESKRERLHGDLDEMRAKRNSLLAREVNLSSHDTEIASIDADIRRIEEETKEIEKKLVVERKIGERRRLNELLLKISGGEKTEQALKSLERFRLPEIESLDALQGELNSLEKEAGRKEYEKERLQQQLREKRGESNRIETAAREPSARGRLATEYKDRVLQFRQSPTETGLTRLRWPLLAVSLLMLVLGVSVFLVLEDTGFKVLSLSMGIFFAVILALLAVRGESSNDAARAASFLQHFKTEWQSRLRTSAPLESPNLDALSMELQGITDEADRAARALDRSRAETAGMERSLEELSESSTKLQEHQARQRALIERWLGERHVASRDEYVEKSRDYRNLERKQAQWLEEMDREMESLEIESIALLKADCERRLRELDGERIPNRGRSEREVHDLESILRDKRILLDDGRQRRTELHSRLAQEKGELTGSLGELPQLIASLEGELGECEKRIENILLDREAARMVSDIFRRIAQDSESVLQELGREIGRRYGEIVPEIRRVGLTEFSTDALTVTDEGGEERAMRHLSRGSQDSFLLAARLALADRAHPQAGVLILDEPFHTLDAERTVKALQMLKDFQVQRGWQIILLSKDAQIETRIRGIFEDPTINRL
ncbi:MAG TPA: ATP-binding protein [Spirochaetia bacterium]|nr:ATP-binding protein [Spirochaetia bacterium]